MSENFELAMAVVQSREHFFPHSLNEDFKNRVLATRLRKAGVVCEANTSGKGADILGSDFVIEGKNALTSSTVLYTLKGQIDSNVQGGNRQIGVVIYGNASKRFLDELKSFISGYYTTDIRVCVRDKLLGDGSNSKQPATSVEPVSTWLKL